jgi:large subunit ribosomal protein L24
MVARIKKKDSVVVISGRDKGKRGSVIDILPKKDKVVVEGVAIVTKHVKARRAGEQAGIKREESLIDLCKVMPVCTSCNKPCRVNVKSVSGKNTLSCNRCQEIF